MDRLVGRGGTMKGLQGYAPSPSMRASKASGVHVALGRRSLRPEGSAGPGYGYGAVDGAVKRMNQWLSTSNAFDGRETGEKDSFMPLRFRNRNQNRKLTIRAQKRASEEIREASDQDRLLKQYLVLPPEEYALLDPRYVQRNPHKGPSAFLITVPLDELLGIDLTPIVSVQVFVNKEDEEVRFTVDGFSFGNPDMDKYVDIQIQSTLYSTNNHGRFRRFSRSGNIAKNDQNEEPECKSQTADNTNNVSCHDSGAGTSQAPENNRVYGRSVEMHHSMHESLGTRGAEVVALANEDSGVSDSAVLDNTPQVETDSVVNDYDDIPANHNLDSLGLLSSSLEHDEFHTVHSELDGKKVRLHCQVQVRLTTSIPPALLFIPNPVLGSVGRVILRSVLNALLPNFLELASKDYQRWVSGERTCHSGVGSLVGA